MKLPTALAIALALTSPAAAQTAAPPTPVIAAPRDVPYPGAIDLKVDATDLDRHIFTVSETIPVEGPGLMTLLYPQWLPGAHAARGPVDKIGGLTISAGGQPLAWRRDPVNVHAFHIDVPAGAKTLDIAFQFLSPTARNQGRVVMTPDMLNLQWNALVLYPAGHYASQITVRPSVVLPEGWSYGTALETAGAPGTFKPVSLETLVDSPMFAGRHFRQVELDPRVRLNIVADSPELLAAEPEQIAAHRALVTQADRLFGARHFDHYDFLLALSDQMSGIGLEHHRSSENGVEPKYFTDWKATAPERDLLPHEYAHSWNGKFRRPADLWTPGYDVAMRDSLLWVYEGQTQYWGYMLSARSGLLSPEDTRAALAMIAAGYDEGRPGRAWRSLADTTNDPIVTQRRPQAWTSWQRNEDYYNEGLLVWLDVDTLIREKTGGAKSLDDFARAFFGMRDGDVGPMTYDLADVVAALNGVAAHDWAGFLKARLDKVGGPAPLEGLARAGWRLVFTDEPTAYFKQADTLRETHNLAYSLGFTVGKDGELSNVLWEGPAFKAGLTGAAKLVAVNGLAYSLERLKDAITAAKGDGPAVELLVRSGDRYRTVALDYHGGLRYPRLERIEGAPDRLGQIMAARK